MTLAALSGNFGGKTGLYIVGLLDGHGVQRGRVRKGVSNTLKTGGNTGLILIDETVRIRRLTPRECFRLMGFIDNDFDKVKGINMSDTQLYKQAGNSIMVNVLEVIFKNLFLEEETPVIQKLF